MYAVILLKDPERYARESWEQVPDLVEYEGASYSLRAGPRQPLATDWQWDPVAVYAPDEFTEEEFQDLYAAHRPHVAELGLKY
ncbi:hypothetical protein [Stenotrophomonas acidaminiphila]|uniref:Uncharacterized protein n=1 Tax=Stenotrophomonas acidaminiphila TaxID=128780 RepID=A0A0S1B3H9_9GAMM|nr:hypothetical protein [Stenotrophomonas acidaminiphila]ALJ29639.1 hypothetical protein AOT14_32990 [Stenotrophomonas acidaminiphila]